MAAGLAVLSTFANPNGIWFGAGLTLASVCWLGTEVVGGHEYRRLRDAALAEEFTSDELKSLRSTGWRHIDCVEFHRFDVDHVVVGPGGVVVVETKWTNVSWPIRDGEFVNRYARNAVIQAARNAADIRSLLRWNFKIDVDVIPALMIWGDGRPSLDHPFREQQGVIVATRSLLAAHLKNLNAVLTSARIDEIYTAINKYVTDKEQLDRRKEHARNLATNHA